MNTVWRMLIEEPAVTLPWMRDKELLGIGWGEIGNLRKFDSPEAMAEAIRKRNRNDPNHKHHKPANSWHGSHSLWGFANIMKPGNFVIINGEVDGVSQRILVVEVLGDYEYARRPIGPRNYRHLRKARVVDGMDPNELWRRAGAHLLNNINFRTLDQCANEIE